MQTKIIDYNKENKTREITSRYRYLLIMLFLVLVSIFTTTIVFANPSPSISNINLTFEKETYSIMEGTSIKIGYNIENQNSAQVKVLLWADCEDEEELECNYSKQVTLSANSMSTGSFYITANEESDVTLTIYVKLLNADNQTIRSFSTNIEITEDEEDGDFEVELYNYSLCIGRSSNVSLEINNNYRDELYNLYLTNPRLTIVSEYSNPVYIRDEKTIDYYISVPKDTEPGQAFDLFLRIENESMTNVKRLTVYATQCPETNIDFTVTGPTTINYSINKEQEKKVSYVIKNNSRTTKTFYISEEHTTEDILVDIYPLQFNLGPGQTKTIDFTFKALKTVRTGTYDFSLNFFDGVNNITKKVKLYINPNYNFKVESITGQTPTLVIGQNLEIALLLNNLGDLSDEFTITTHGSGDLRIRTTQSKVTISPNSGKVISVFISAGENTNIGNYPIYVNITGNNSNFSNETYYNVNVVRTRPIITLELLSFPTGFIIDSNSTIHFDITLKNTGQVTITLSNVELTNIPPNVSLITEQGISIAPGQTKTISSKLIIGDIPKEDIDAKLRFVSNNGGVLEKDITLRFTEKESPEKSKLTGYFTLRNSILFGIIFICLLIMILFALRIIKISK